MIHIKNDFIELDGKLTKKIDFVFLQLQENDIITNDQILALDFNYKFKE